MDPEDFISDKLIWGKRDRVFLSQLWWHHGIGQIYLLASGLFVNFSDDICPQSRT